LSTSAGPRYRFAVEYFGEPFAGWQVQENAVSVQGELEKALETVLRRPVRVTGAGRTDAGVHAAGQVAHFDFPSESEEAVAPFEPRRLQKALNALAGPHIRVRGLEACPPDFHARYTALWRQYVYRIALRPVALLDGISWHPNATFDPELLTAELKTSLGKYDFLSFSIPRHDGKSTLCEVQRVDSVRAGAILEVRIRADRFLHRMVRSLIGAAYDVARGAHAPGLIRSVLEDRFNGERFWAPPRGLCLERVGYPDYDADAQDGQAAPEIDPVRNSDGSVV
jgi:tRNA pseudouridine38-40 synthase